MMKVGIVGVSGYSGAETLKILLHHPHVRVTYISANNTEGKVDDILPELAGRTPLKCEKFDFAKAVQKVDIIFLAVPHTVSMSLTPGFLRAGIKVIDLSGDYRLKQARLYKKWYKTPHLDQKNLRKAVYGLPELYREDIKKAAVVANPGCYPTAALLGLLPFVAVHSKHIASVIIDAKSGVSGAGRKASVALSHGEVSENFKAYKILTHQHAPEIDLYTSAVAGEPLSVQFVPHVLPVNRGILETIYVSLKKPIPLSQISVLYKKFYKREPFIRLKSHVQLKDVTHTNFCDISLHASDDGRLLVITSVIDNLLKGAAGQAVQNMNLMAGFDEKEGLL